MRHTIDFFKIAPRTRRVHGSERGDYFLGFSPLIFSPISTSTTRSHRLSIHSIGIPAGIDGVQRRVDPLENVRCERLTSDFEESFVHNPHHQRSSSCIRYTAHGRSMILCMQVVVLRNLCGARNFVVMGPQCAPRTRQASSPLATDNASQP